MRHVHCTVHMHCPLLLLYSDQFYQCTRFPVIFMQTALARHGRANVTESMLENLNRQPESIHLIKNK
jgi:hypothetical protein